MLLFKENLCHRFTAMTHERHLVFTLILVSQMYLLGSLPVRHEKKCIKVCQFLSDGK